MDAPTRREATLAAPSLEAIHRCAQTGGRLQCAGHWDYFGSYMVWTRHTAPPITATLFRVVPYDHCAPEVLVR